MSEEIKLEDVLSSTNIADLQDKCITLFETYQSSLSEISNLKKDYTNLESKLHHAELTAKAAEDRVIDEKRRTEKLVVDLAKDAKKDFVDDQIENYRASHQYDRPRIGEMTDVDIVRNDEGQIINRHHAHNIPTYKIQSGISRNHESLDVRSYISFEPFEKFNTNRDSRFMVQMDFPEYEMRNMEPRMIAAAVHESVSKLLDQIKDPMAAKVFESIQLDQNHRSMQSPPPMFHGFS